MLNKILQQKGTKKKGIYLNSWTFFWGKTLRELMGNNQASKIN